MGSQIGFSEVERNLKERVPGKNDKSQLLLDTRKPDAILRLAFRNEVNSYGRPAGNALWLSEGKEAQKA